MWRVSLHWLSYHDLKCSVATWRCPVKDSCTFPNIQVIFSRLERKRNPSFDVWLPGCYQSFLICTVFPPRGAQVVSSARYLSAADYYKKSHELVAEPCWIKPATLKLLKRIFNVITLTTCKITFFSQLICTFYKQNITIALQVFTQAAQKFFWFYSNLKRNSARLQGPSEPAANRTYLLSAFSSFVYLCVKWRGDRAVEHGWSTLHCFHICRCHSSQQRSADLTIWLLHWNICILQFPEVCRTCTHTHIADTFKLYLMTPFTLEDDTQTCCKQVKLIYNIKIQKKGGMLCNT